MALRGDEVTITLGGAGRSATAVRRSASGRLGLWLAGIAALGASGGIGYLLGLRAASPQATAAIAAATGEADKARPVADGKGAEMAVSVAAKPAAQPVGDSPPMAAAEPEAPAQPEPLGAPGEPLRVVLENEEEVELHPLSMDGRPMPEDFARLSAAFTCEGETDVAIAPALVQVLIEAQEELNRPIEIMGGRCAKHPESNGSLAEHAHGRGADIRMRGVSSARLSDWLKAAEVPGVGRYKRAGFVHVDVRAGAEAHWEPESDSSASAQAPARKAARPQLDGADDGDAAEEAAAPKAAIDDDSLVASDR